MLQVGFSCNARCRFCYYRDSLKAGTVRDFTADEVKAKLREARRLGKDMVDISGGEQQLGVTFLRLSALQGALASGRFALLPTVLGLLTALLLISSLLLA